MTRDRGGRWFIDRREGEWWVLAGEAGQVIELPVWLLPGEAREGDALDIRIEDDGAERVTRIRRDPARSAQLRSEIAALQSRLGSREPGGDPGP